MADDHAEPEQRGEAPPRGEPIEERVTSPMQPFTARHVGIGVAVLAVGLLITFGIPLLLA